MYFSPFLSIQHIFAKLIIYFINKKSLKNDWSLIYNIYYM